ncbi:MULTISPECIES: hypothetical protein [unclassified Haloferax]|uniref:hypothetical protein n=1 Tax=unclassified Haloferax TaxID=2625095 RepID=UPI0028752419|nr:MULTISPECIES: hypothetical protein [unclassified Haloferax]MDS0243559.1 hypothetical protein [Haloferax sp. S2CR25]MDS0446680.1 hypothetical protein [Haloferax sp. S2CR25-2]
MTSHTLSPGDEWPEYYRGFRLHTNPDGDVWWQVYQGTDRLYLDPTPESLVEDLLKIKRLGGRVRVTESGDVLTQEEDGDSYKTTWVGTLELQGELVPKDAETFAFDVSPSGLSMGDLWPSVYDGSKFSLGAGGERVWWQNPETGKRHPVETDISGDILAALQSYKPNGGSFRVTPSNEVITLVNAHPAPEQVRSQFGDLPRVVRNVIKLRKERGVEMLPVYIGEIEETPLEVSEPPSLTDSLSVDEREELESWAASLGTTTKTDSKGHTVYSDDPEDW